MSAGWKTLKNLRCVYVFGGSFVTLSVFEVPVRLPSLMGMWFAQGRKKEYPKGGDLQEAVGQAPLSVALSRCHQWRRRLVCDTAGTIHSRGGGFWQKRVQDNGILSPQITSGFEIEDRVSAAE